MNITKHSVVSAHYTLTDPEGNQLDSSAGSDPLVYLHGANNLIPGLESAMDGKKAGDKFKVDVQPDQAYGARDEDLVKTVPRSIFEGIDEISPGDMFQAQAADGGVQHVTVLALEGDNIKVDGNHPLAGMVLSFDVEIVDVREASAEEIEHGHPHE